MKVARQLAKVRLAQAEVRAARTELGEPARALVERVREYPLTSVGAAAGTGVVLAQLDVHPLRVPGVGRLLSSGLLPLVLEGVHLLAEKGLDGFDAFRAGAEPADTP